MMSAVKVGQIWDFMGESTTAPPYARGWRCVVVAENDSREAGPDSWEMRCLDRVPGYYGKTMYMHHHRRVEGKWRRITRWRRICEWLGIDWPRTTQARDPQR